MIMSACGRADLHSTAQPPGTRFAAEAGILRARRQCI